MKKALLIIKNILVYCLLAFALFAVVLTISSKKSSDGATEIFGYETRIVLSNSMEKCNQTDVSKYKIKDIPVKSMIFIEKVPEDQQKKEQFYANIKVGDVLTFKYVYVKQETITHRVTSIEPKEGSGYIVRLEGDNKGSDSKTLTQVIDTSDEESFNYIIGKVKGVSLPLGFIVYTLKQKVGIICFIILPCSLLIIWEVIKIVNVIKSDKKEAQQKQISEKDNEIERLKQQLNAYKDSSEKEMEENV